MARSEQAGMMSRMLDNGSVRAGGNDEQDAGRWLGLSSQGSWLGLSSQQE